MVCLSLESVLIKNQITEYDLCGLNLESNDLNDLCSELKIKVVDKIRLKTVIAELQSEKAIQEYYVYFMHLRDSFIESEKMRGSPNWDLSKYKIESQPVNILLLGDSGVGKSCIIDRMAHDSFTNKLPTVSLDICELNAITDHTRFKLRIWDTPGQDKIRGNVLSPLNMRQSNGVIFVYSICDRKSFERLDSCMEEVSDKTDISDKCIVLCGNMADKHIKHRRVTAIEGFEKAQRWSAKLLLMDIKSNFMKAVLRLHEKLQNCFKRLH